MFDSSIGAGSVLMPYGGKYQLTETQAMVAKLPVLEGKTDTVTMMAYGFDPYLSSWSPYHGAVYAVVESIAKIVAGGGDYQQDPFYLPGVFPQNERRSEQMEPAFCSSFGSLMRHRWDLDFLLSVEKTVCPVPSMRLMYRRLWFLLQWMWQADKTMITPELKKAGNKLVLFQIEKDAYDLPVYEQVMDLLWQVLRGRKGWKDRISL